MFVLYVVIASVPYASLGEGRYVGPNPSLHIMQWRTNMLVVPYLESCQRYPVSAAPRGGDAGRLARWERATRGPLIIGTDSWRHTISRGSPFLHCLSVGNISPPKPERISESALRQWWLAVVVEGTPIPQDGPKNIQLH